MPRQQGRGVAAGQSGMRVDDVNRSLSAKPRHLVPANEHRAIAPRSTGLDFREFAGTSPNSQAADGCGCLTAMVKRGYSNDAGGDAKLLKLPGWILR